MTEKTKTQNTKIKTKKMKDLNIQSEYKKKIESVKNAVNYQNLDSLIKGINKLVTIHKDWLAVVNSEAKKQEFNEWEKRNGLDWNEYFHDFEDFIENEYHELKDKYQDLHFETHQFSAY